MKIPQCMHAPRFLNTHRYLSTKQINTPGIKPYVIPAAIRAMYY